MTAEITKTIDDDYLLYLPIGYDDNPQDWPLVIYLHGSGSAIWDLDAIRDGGPPQLFEEGMDTDFVLLCPQLHDDVHWDVDRIHALTLEIMETYGIDEHRVYLTGLSRGGFGAWEFGVSYPNLFAGVVPISARDVAGVERLANTATWIFHGDQDTGVPWQGSQVAFDRLNAADGDVHFTLYEGVGHWAWEPAYATLGLWTWLLSQENELADVINPDEQIPGDGVLRGNFPNPFNPTTTLRFGLPEDSEVTLIVYDIQGKLVKSLVNEAMPGGWHDVTWNAVDQRGNPLSTGVYLCRLDAENYSRTIRMLYLK